MGVSVDILSLERERSEVRGGCLELYGICLEMWKV